MKQTYYEEQVIFYHWLCYQQPRPIEYPTNQQVWSIVCSMSLRVALEEFLLEHEYQAWTRYRASAIRQLGERFVADPECSEGIRRRQSDEQIRHNRAYWG